MGEMGSICKILVGKLEGKRLLGRPRRRQDDNIRMDPREIWWGVVEWIDLAQNWHQGRTLVNTAMNLPTP
jgi:hypothetical protein